MDQERALEQVLEQDLETEILFLTLVNQVVFNVLTELLPKTENAFPIVNAPKDIIAILPGYKVALREHLMI